MNEFLCFKYTISSENMQESVRRERHFMSKNSSEATEKNGTGIVRMVRVNCSEFVFLLKIS